MSESKTDFHCKVDADNDTDLVCSEVPGTSNEPEDQESVEHNEQNGEPELLHEYQDLPAVTI